LGGEAGVGVAAGLKGIIGGLAPAMITLVRLRCFDFDRTDSLGAPSETRTPDPLIKSQLLYQLS
jgi:hypothetical protein